MADYKIPEERHKFMSKVIELSELDCVVSLVKRKKTRTSRQNAALHLFFTFISDGLNEMGQTFNYTGIKGFDMELKYTPFLVKETLWRPIQIALFEIESTKDINTSQMNYIIDVIIKYFSERGYSLDFPSIQSLMWKTIGENT